MDEEDDEALRADELLAALPLPVYAVDARGFMLHYNKAARDLWGREPPEGCRWCAALQLFDLAGRELSPEESALALSVGQKREVAGRHLLGRPDGERIAFTSWPSLIWRDGQVVGATNTLFVDTPARQDEELRSRLAAIVTFSHDAIVSKDLHGVITSWNESARRVFGYEAEEVVGKPINILIPPERQGEEPVILERIRRGEVVDHFETIRVRKDGTRIPISLTISPIRSSNGTIIGVSKIARDITDKRENERRIGELLREVNHRVKNQFAVILSMVRETNKRASDPVQFERLVRERIMALSRTHDLLVQTEWRGVSMKHLLLSHLRAAGDEDLLTLSGQDVVLSPMAAQYLGMAFQELLMNSALDGALGRNEPLQVSWETPGDPEGTMLSIRWLERFHGGQLFQSEDGSFSEILLCKAAPTAVSGRATLTLAEGVLDWQLKAPLSAVIPA